MADGLQKNSSGSGGLVEREIRPQPVFPILFEQTIGRIYQADYGIIIRTLVFKGDTLFEHAEGRWDYVYMKTRVPVKSLNYQATW